MTLLPVLLPEGYVVKVSANKKVAAGDIIAEKKEGSVSEEIVHVSESLNISPQKISKILKKNLGDAISKGEVLAAKSGALGITSKKIISEFSGTIVKIDEESGDVTIRGNTEGQSLKTIISPVAGVVDFCNNEKIIIKTDKDAILALDGLGEENEGELLYIENFEETGLTREIEEKVILVRAIDKVSVFKAIGLDASGIITEGFEDADFIDFSQKNVEMPVMIINDDDFKKLASSSGKRVYLGGKDKSIIIL